MQVDRTTVADPEAGEFMAPAPALPPVVNTRVRREDIEALAHPQNGDDRRRDARRGPASLVDAVVQAHSTHLSALRDVHRRFLTHQTNVVSIIAGRPQQNGHAAVHAAAVTKIATPVGVGKLAATVAELAARHRQAGPLSLRLVLSAGFPLPVTVGLTEAPAQGDELAAWRGQADDQTPVCRAALLKDVAAVGEEPVPAASRRLELSAAATAAILDGGREYPGEKFTRLAAHVRTPRVAGGAATGHLSLMDFTPCDDGDRAGALRGGLDLGTPAQSLACAIDAVIDAAALLMLASGRGIDRDSWVLRPTGTLLLQFDPADFTGAPLMAEVRVTGRLVAEATRPTLRASGTVVAGERCLLRVAPIDVELAPDWPDDPVEPPLDPEALARLPAAFAFEGIVWDHAQLVRGTRACPSRVFGPRFAGFDEKPRMMRLPAPPLTMMSRVLSCQGAAGAMAIGSSVRTAYVISPDAWYFGGSGMRFMPFSILMEILLQPCGWLTLFQGFMTAAQKPVRLRNLDGKLIQYEPVPASADARVVVIECSLARATRIDDTFLLGFRIAATLDGRPLVDLDTEFGLFSDAALDQQIGLAPKDQAWAAVSQADDRFIDLTGAPLRTPNGLGLPVGRLRMIDAVTAFSDKGGAAQLGRIKARQQIDPSAWYFKSHFFQDPVQPGSLGIEGFAQTLQAFAILAGLAGDATAFAPQGSENTLAWKYRGQILPETETVEYDVEVTRVEHADGLTCLTARGLLYADNRCIYSIDGLILRIVRRDPAHEPSWLVTPISLERMPWLNDHKPNYTAAVMPLVGMLEMLAAKAVAMRPHLKVTQVRDLRVYRWLVVDRASETRIVAAETEPGIVEARLEIWRQSNVTALSRFEPVASGVFILGETYPAPPPPLAALTDAWLCEDPYASGAMFHGPSFRSVEHLERSADGGSARAGMTGLVPVGLLNPALLDSAMHGIPNDRLHEWFAEANPDHVSYPSRISSLDFHGPTPRSGMARIEIRRGRQLDEFARHFDFAIQIFVDERLWASFTLVSVCFPRGDLTRVDRPRIADLMRGDYYCPCAHLAKRGPDGALSLTAQDVARANWLPGSVEFIFDVDPASPDLLETLLIKEAIAVETVTHPRFIERSGDGGRSCRLPYSSLSVSIERSGEDAAIARVISETFDRAALARRLVADGPDPGGRVSAMRLWLEQRLGRVALTSSKAERVALIAFESVGGPVDPLLLHLAALSAEIDGAMPPAVEVIGDDVEAAVSGAATEGSVLIVRAFVMTDGRGVVHPGQIDLRIGWAPLSADAAAREQRRRVWMDSEPRRDPDVPAPKPQGMAIDGDLGSLIARCESGAGHRGGMP